MIRFAQYADPDGAINPKFIYYFDEEGKQWTVPMGAGHRWEEMYDSWLAEGNTVEPPPSPQSMSI